jgi:hypothetical protein
MIAHMLALFLFHIGLAGFLLTFSRVQQWPQRGTALKFWAFVCCAAAITEGASVSFLPPYSLLTLFTYNGAWWLAARIPQALFVLGIAINIKDRMARISVIATAISVMVLSLWSIYHDFYLRHWFRRLAYTGSFTGNYLYDLSVVLSALFNLLAALAFVAFLLLYRRAELGPEMPAIAAIQRTGIGE